MQRPYCILLKKETFVKIKELLQFFQSNRAELEKIKSDKDDKYANFYFCSSFVNFFSDFLNL